MKNTIFLRAIEASPICYNVQPSESLFTFLMLYNSLNPTLTLLIKKIWIGGLSMTKTQFLIVGSRLAVRLFRNCTTVLELIRLTNMMKIVMPRPSHSLLVLCQFCSLHLLFLLNYTFFIYQNSYRIKKADRCKNS